MSGTQMSNEHATRTPTAGMVDMKLEVVVIPVYESSTLARFARSQSGRLSREYRVWSTPRSTSSAERRR